MKNQTNFKLLTLNKIDQNNIRGGQVIIEEDVIFVNSEGGIIEDDVIVINSIFGEDSGF